MIDAVGIENFRCFEKAELSDLRPINIIVGRNSSGKTALLEALFLALGATPELVFRLNRWRGMGESIRLSSDRRSYESLWQYLFYSTEENRTISIKLTDKLTGSSSLNRSLKVFYKPGESHLTLPISGEDIDSARILPITFEWTDANGKVASVQPMITPQGLKVGSAGDAVPAALISSFLVPTPQENASRFSELSKADQEKEFIELFRREFPWIENLSIQISGGISQVFVTLSSMRVKVPITMVSGGVNKLLTILLAMANFPKGVVLIDELENGFYFDRLLPIWSLILRFAQQYDTQVFVTTHGRECLRAALPVMKINEDDFRLIRLEREASHSIARLYGGKDSRRAIEQDIEVR